MTMALRHGCLLGAFLLLCTAQLSSATLCVNGPPLSHVTCGKSCPGNYNCALGVNSNRGICCPIGFLGHPPPYTTIGLGYQQALEDLLIPKNRELNYVVKLRFRAPAITIPDVCGHDLPFPAVDTVVSGHQETVGKTALAIGCNGIERNLGTTVYQFKPDAFIQMLDGEGVLRSPPNTERYCLFMFDVGTDQTPGSDTDLNIEEATPFYQRYKPYVHWSTCNIPGNNINSATVTVLKEYQQVPSNAAATRRITYVLFKQPGLQDNMHINDFLAYPNNPGCDRCRFDIRRFIEHYRLETKAVLTVRAAADAVGMALIRKFQRLTSAQMCGVYNQAQEENGPTDDGSHSSM